MGIDHQIGPPDTPQHNGVAERFNRTLLMKTRALLFDSGLPQYMWDLAVRFAVFIYNRTPHRSNQFEIPLRKFAPHKPCNSGQIKRFGSLAYMKTPRQFDSQKCSAKAMRTFLVGFLDTGYLLYCNKRKIFYQSHNVRFNEALVYKNIETKISANTSDDLLSLIHI